MIVLSHPFYIGIFLFYINKSIHDRPDKVLGIEIYNCFEYLENRDHWNGCGMLLHEFCHLIHQLVLPDGLDNIDVKNMYDCAMRSRIYDEVIR